MYRFSPSLLASLLLFGVIACIDDPAAVDDQFALSQEDAELLGLTVWRHALEVQLDFDVGGQSTSAEPAPSPQRVPEVYTDTDTTVVACELGGEIERIMEASLIVDLEADELEIDATLTLTHDACREEIEGQIFSFYGAPTMVVGVNTFYGADDVQTISGSIAGSVVVITEGAPLLCEASVVVEDGVITEESTTYRVRGTFCGANMDQMVTEPTS